MVVEVEKVVVVACAGEAYPWYDAPKLPHRDRRSVGCVAAGEVKLHIGVGGAVLRVWLATYCAVLACAAGNGRAVADG